MLYVNQARMVLLCLFDIKRLLFNNTKDFFFLEANVDLSQALPVRLFK